MQEISQPPSYFIVKCVYVFTFCFNFEFASLNHVRFGYPITMKRNETLCVSLLRNDRFVIEL